MLPRKLIYQLLLFQKRPGNPFYQMPKNVISTISNAGFDPNSDIAALLKYIVYGNVAEIKMMLEHNPELLREVGHVKTPGGDTVLRVTPYECALGSADAYKDHQDIEMIPLIASYFGRINNGEAELARQTANMRPYIDGMLKNIYYVNEELCRLTGLIMDSLSTDVTAALEKKFVPGNQLHDALQNYRLRRSPRTIAKGMHYNYTNLLNVLWHLSDIWRLLVNSGDGNYDRCRLAMRQIFGWELRSLPMCDRQAFANSLRYNKPLLTRDLKLVGDEGDFPMTAGDESTAGLGWDYWIDVFRGRRNQGQNLEEDLHDSPVHILNALKRHFQEKVSRLSTFTNLPNAQADTCQAGRGRVNVLRK